MSAVTSGTFRSCAVATMAQAVGLCSRIRAPARGSLEWEHAPPLIRIAGRERKEHRTGSASLCLVFLTFCRGGKLRTFWRGGGKPSGYDSTISVMLSASINTHPPELSK